MPLQILRLHGDIHHVQLVDLVETGVSCRLPYGMPIAQGVAGHLLHVWAHERRMATVIAVDAVDHRVQRMRMRMRVAVGSAAVLALPGLPWSQTNPRRKWGGVSSGWKCGRHFEGCGATRVDLHGAAGALVLTPPGAERLVCRMIEEIDCQIDRGVGACWHGAQDGIQARQR